LFTLFSFLYLYIFQADVMEALHDALSHGHTEYDPLIGAIIVTVVLLILRWGINKLMGLKGPLRAWAYFPSCLLLGVLTDVQRTIFHGDGFADRWQWSLPLILGVYVVVGFGLRRLLRRWLDQPMSPQFLWNSNLLTLLACFLLTVAVGNTDVDFHRELRVESSLRQHDYARAMQVGLHATHTTHTLTALRALTLSLQGEMGNRLFDYPQPYGAAGLMFPKDSLRTLRLDNDSLTLYLAGPRRRSETTVAYLERGFNDGNGRYTVFDYYLCALLLDKQLDRFVRVAAHNLDAENMPRHYREALALYQHLHPAYKGLGADEATQAQLSDFVRRAQEYPTEEEGARALRPDFGRTYWWYFRYQ
jgi:fluoride ion exporter CrcB/FEX